MRVVLAGLGTTGSHIARQLTQSPVTELVLWDPKPRRLDQVLGAVRAVASAHQTITTAKELTPATLGADVLVLGGPAGTHREPAAAALRAGSHVVSISDEADEVADLLALGSLARSADRALVVGAGFCPGLSCLLVSHAAAQLDRVDVINVYRAGTGGPACARQHHRTLKHSGQEWLEGTWIVRRGGSGRDLAWFPEPFGARDCYRGALSSPLLLQPQFPGAHRITARMAATRRDRFTSRLPMLRPPHTDGGPGAIRVELRGRVGQAVETVILGVMDHPSVAGGTVAALAALAALEGRAPVGASGLAGWPTARPLLADLRQRGVRVAAFGGRLTDLA
ncbi:MAG: Gfo/Idh/MocA family oxidoreductase [Acidimicrobiales bacterium]